MLHGEKNHMSLEQHKGEHMLIDCLFLGELAL